jgi:hypothetical protein
MANQKEQWKEIEGFSDYEISNLGRVKRTTPACQTAIGRILCPWEQSWGYLQVTLNGKHKRVHILVLNAFIGPCPAGHEGNHKDGNKKNNRIDNLEWITPSGNMYHSYKTGLHPKLTGEKHPMAKLNEGQVNEIKRELKNKKWGLVSELARKYNVNKSTISGIGLGKSWN